MNVTVLGLGYVGCVSAACLSRDGHQVIGVDVSEDKVRLIATGRSPVAEPGLQSLVAEQVRAGRLSATSCLKSAVRRSDVALVAVGTPSLPDGSVNAGAVLRVIRQLGELLRGTSRKFTIVIRSTLLPDVLQQQVLPALEESLGGPKSGANVRLCTNPEFLREATALADYDQPPFVLVGANSPADAEPVFALYEKIPGERICVDSRTAALVKYAANAFHALKISFANEIGTLARTLGADGQQVMEIVCQDTRLNISSAYLRPGFAFGGSCLPKDLRALVRVAQQHAVDAQLLGSILPSNQSHQERAIRQIQATGYKRIGLVGLSFKSGTDDVRESPSAQLAEVLLGRGFHLRIYDAAVRHQRLVGRNLDYVKQHLPHLAELLVEHPDELFEHAELLVLASDDADRIGWRHAFQGPCLDLRRDLVAPSEVAPLQTIEAGP